VLPVAKEVTKDLDKPEVIKNVTSMVKIMDALYASEDGVQQLDLLINKLDKIIREKANFQLLTTN
jgi:hypothetical protein